MDTRESERLASSMKQLAMRLQNLEAVRKHSDEEHDEAWTLAHSLIDIEQSCRALIEEMLPQIRGEDLSDDDRYDLLLEIGEEYRHLLYHIRDPRFWGYLNRDT